MYNLDSLSLKYLIEENSGFLNGATVQKIQMPSKREILLSLRNNGENRKLYINTDPKFAHINFITNKENYSIKIPKEPPMFCMLLRKHMEGAKLNRVEVVEYERIAEFYFETYDEIGSLFPMCLSVEFMGKHSNAILYNASNKIITGCVHNISPEKSSVREVWGGIKYIRPPKQEKTDILKTSFAGFYGVLESANFQDSFKDNTKDLQPEAYGQNRVSDAISNHYYYFSKGFLNFILNKFEITAPCNIEQEKLFSFLQSAVSGNSSIVKEFWRQNILNEKISKPDNEILPPAINPLNSSIKDFSLNFLIEKYFSHFVLSDVLGAKKSYLKKLLGKEYKRYKDTILNSNKKNSYELNRKKGELILANMYTPELSNGFGEKILLDGIEISLDTTKTLPENAQRYFSLYQKGKTAKEIQDKREKEAKDNLEYLDGIIFSIENVKDIDTLDEIEEELTDFLGSAYGNNATGKKEKTVKISVKSIDYKGFEIFIGKNNKQNDYLIKKISSPEDIWLHAKDCPSGHCFIRTENGRKNVPDDVLLFACNLVKENSPMKNSAKASIIHTKRKFIKRPPDTHPGYVTYREEKEIVV